MIAHRLSTVLSADRVLVLDRGCLVQEGSPARLLAEEGGLFARLNRAEQQVLPRHVLAPEQEPGHQGC